MKKVTIILITLAIPFMLIAQESQVEKIFDKYSGKEGYTSVYITKYMFNLFAKIANEDEDKEFKEITSKLDGMKILAVESDDNSTKSSDFYREIRGSFPEGEYKVLMLIKEGEEKIKFLIREDHGKISEFVMIIGGDGDAVLIVLQGDIDLEKISKLSKTMDIDGFEYLEKLDKENGQQDKAE